MPLSAGAKLRPYEILAPIGAGGMGQVYKARDTRLDRIVAIKVLPADKVADADRKQRFRQEAKAASSLNHPNIITIYDIGSGNGIDYLAMEFVAGKTLDQLKRVTFYSGRAGRLDIWVANADGSQAARLTSMNATTSGSPRWSPDGQQIAFDSNVGGLFHIYTRSPPMAANRGG